MFLKWSFVSQFCLKCVDPEFRHNVAVHYQRIIILKINFYLMFKLFFYELLYWRWFNWSNILSWSYVSWIFSEIKKTGYLTERCWRKCERRDRYVIYKFFIGLFVIIFIIFMSSQMSMKCTCNLFYSFTSLQFLPFFFFS